MSRVPRIGRILDVVGVLLFVTGAGFFAWAWVGFGEVPAYVPDPSDEPWAAIQRADGFLRLQRIGAGLMATGLAVGVAAWWKSRGVPVVDG